MRNPKNTDVPITAYIGVVIAMTVPMKTYAMIKMMGSIGYNFIEYIPVPSRCLVRFRRMKIVAADVAIPMESRNIVKLNISLNWSAKNNTTTQIAAKTVRLIEST